VFDFEIRSSVHDYSVHFGDAGEALAASLDVQRDILFVDARVSGAHAPLFEDYLSDPRHVVLEASEELKSYGGVQAVMDHIFRSGFDRGGKLVAVGGGTVQDAVAFIASILFRGVSWMFLPTTLLAQCDSCIGGKTSINYGRYKNQLGSFYPPHRIIIDDRFLRSLDQREMDSGLGEMAHYFLLEGEEAFEMFRSNAPRAFSDVEALRELVHRSLEIKRGYIEKDEFDRGPRQLLNYGHSFGHALEAVTDYGLPHGIAVCYGMDLANFISVERGYLSAADREGMRSVLAPIWDGYALRGISIDAYLAALRRDKKNIGGTVGLVLSRGVGDMFRIQQEVDESFTATIATYLENEV